jgi:soluble lytic murein transglycosylase-like protein/tetratricopeptide (TPR) repeat protein
MSLSRPRAILLGLGLVTSTGWAGLEELARSGQWEQLLQVATRRASQLPLRADEAYLAAVAARSLGDRGAEEQFLMRAAEEGPFDELAGLVMAEVVLADDTARAVELAIPTLRRASTRAMREAAVSVAIDALERGIDEASRAQLEHVLTALPRSLRRRLDLALAASDGAGSRQRLGRLMASSTRDLEALGAARILQLQDDLAVLEKWWVAQALYRHALYQEAEPILESLDAVVHRSIPRWQVAYLRGRCAFRQGRWAEAVEWYAKAGARARGGERAADLEVHRARALELGGRMDDAISAAQRAVRLRTTDERRLFLARLRLRLDQPELAIQGISRVRGRSARARGELLLALYDIRHGAKEEARRRLEGVRRQPWEGPAAVLAAGLAAETGDWRRVVTLLERAAPVVDPFWAERARELMGRIPAEDLKAWREGCSLAAHEAPGRSRRRAMARWATLEPDEERLLSIRLAVAQTMGLDEGEEPGFEEGLAHELWRRGLHDEAVRWDSGGLPRRDARSTSWTAERFLDLDIPGAAIRTADAAWRMAGSDIPIRAFPDGLRRSSYPLPQPAAVWRASVENAVPWSLMAALAREESRWEPRAVSRVGARGLMQLMPATAADAALRRGDPQPTPEELFDPELSLRLGAAEMNRLLESFGGRWAPAVAAYNAGEPQARQWLVECGDRCTEELYVSYIAFSATRKYTRDVLVAAGVYTELYGAAPVESVASTVTASKSAGGK